MSAQSQWFRRLADVPKLNYKSPPEAERAKLPARKVVPDVSRYQVDNRERVSVMWPSPDGNGQTSASPARQWETKPRNGEGPRETALRQLYEQLELPGTLNDYVGCIQVATTVLHKHRHGAPWVYTTLEQLYWLIIRIVETYPDVLVLSSTSDRAPFYYGSFAYRSLTSLYEREGYLREACDLARRGQRFGGADDKEIASLDDRLAALARETDD